MFVYARQWPSLAIFAVLQDLRGTRRAHANRRIKFLRFASEFASASVHLLTRTLHFRTMFGLALLLLPLIGQAQTQRPNFLIIISDDQRYDEMVLMPQTFAKIFEPGCEFKRAYVTTPLCCPSRSSILTGMYASKHGVKDNTYILTKPTFVQMLKQQAGYFTGHIGKYLNSADGSPRKEYDYWVGQKGGLAHYIDPILNVGGKWRRMQGYSTYLFRDFANEFLERAAKQPNPFMLYLAFHAPHFAANVAPQERGAAATLELCRATALGYLNEQRRLGVGRAVDAGELKIDDDPTCRHKLTLLSLDRAVADVLDRLSALGLSENTVVFFISDNGLLFGEHGLYAVKESPYEEAVRVPFGVRWPARIAPQQSAQIVANIDIAPTVLAMAGLPIPAQMDGANLLDAIEGRPWRENVMIEGFNRSVGHRKFAGLVSSDSVLMRFFTGNQTFSQKFFDLNADPFELQDQSVNFELTPRRLALQTKLEELLERYKPVKAPRAAKR